MDFLDEVTASPVLTVQASNSGAFGFVMGSVDSLIPSTCQDDTLTAQLPAVSMKTKFIKRVQPSMHKDSLQNRLCRNTTIGHSRQSSAANMVKICLQEGNLPQPCLNESSQLSDYHSKECSEAEEEIIISKTDFQGESLAKRLRMTRKSSKTSLISPASSKSQVKFLENVSMSQKSKTVISSKYDDRIDTIRDIDELLLERSDFALFHHRKMLESCTLPYLVDTLNENASKREIMDNVRAYNKKTNPHRGLKTTVTLKTTLAISMS